MQWEVLKRWEALKRWRKEAKVPQKFVEKIRDQFVDFCGPMRGRILEVGCGKGFVRTSPFWPSTAKYWGIDPIVINSFRYDFPFVVAVAEHLPFRNRSFDYVIVKDSLDHFYDPYHFCGEAYRVLKTQGYIIIGQSIKTSPFLKAKRIFKLIFSNSQKKMNKLKQILYLFKNKILTDRTHMWHFDERQLKRIFADRFHICDEKLIDGCLLLKCKKGIS